MTTVTRIDWETVPTQRQLEEEAIWEQTERLHLAVQEMSQEIDTWTEDPGQMTPSGIAETFTELASTLRDLVGLFRAHLAAVDLDDETKAVAVSGGSITGSY